MRIRDCLVGATTLLAFMQCVLTAFGQGCDLVDLGAAVAYGVNNSNEDVGAEMRKDRGNLTVAVWYTGVAKLEYWMGYCRATAINAPSLAVGWATGVALRP